MLKMASRFCIQRARAYSTVAKIPKRRGEYIYGASTCLAALQAKRRRIYNMFIQEGTQQGERALEMIKLEELHKYAQEHNIALYWMPKASLDRMSNERPTQGIIFDAEPLKFKSMHPEECRISEAKRRENPIWLALDGVTDPMNLGAILRCSYYFGVERVVVTPRNSCSLTAVVSKASAGAMELFTVHAVADLAEFLKSAERNDWFIVGTCAPPPDTTCAPPPDTPIEMTPVLDCTRLKVIKPTLILIGNESKGLRSTIKRLCKQMISIYPSRTLKHGFDSLNVSVATGILLHTLQTSKRTK